LGRSHKIFLLSDQEVNIIGKTSQISIDIKKKALSRNRGRFLFCGIITAYQVSTLALVERPDSLFGESTQRVIRMRQQLEERINQLKAEFEAGKKRLAELEAQQAAVRETMQRISKAIQTLEEELANTANDPTPTSSNNLPSKS
jgi:septal ring factor EnvC (AmiA/AmiB activator)